MEAVVSTWRKRTNCQVLYSAASSNNQLTQAHSSASSACRQQLVRLHAEETVEPNRVDGKIKCAAERLSLCSVLKSSISTNRRNISTKLHSLKATLWDELLGKSLLTSQFAFICEYGRMVAVDVRLTKYFFCTVHTLIFVGTSSII